MRYHRQTWIEVDLDAIFYNVKQALRLNLNKTLMAVVKANGYGHGDIEVAQVALDAGAQMLAVSSLDEALYLRKSGFSCPILMMGSIELTDVYLAIDNNISITAHDVIWISELLALKFNKLLHIHLKIDSGMNRLGLSRKTEIVDCFNRLKEHPMIKIEGIYTHMATADEDLGYLAFQVKNFKDGLSLVDLTVVDYVHLANSATLLQANHPFTNAVRFGIGMYGVNPGGDFISLDFKLKPTLALYSRLSQCKKIKKGAKVGYGATYVAKEDEWIGTVPIGYADGWIRQNQDRHVIVEGQRCAIVGRICMDQLMIKLPNEIPRGTKVTLIGPKMPVEVVAKELDTIAYEVFCLLSDRIPRIYKKNNEIIGMRHIRFQS